MPLNKENRPNLLSKGLRVWDFPKKENAYWVKIFLSHPIMCICMQEDFLLKPDLVSDMPLDTYHKCTKPLRVSQKDLHKKRLSLNALQNVLIRS